MNLLSIIVCFFACIGIADLRELDSDSFRLLSLSASFNPSGFQLTWTPQQNAPPGCTMQLYLFEGTPIMSSLSSKKALFGVSVDLSANSSTVPMGQVSSSIKVGKNFYWCNVDEYTPAFYLLKTALRCSAHVVITPIVPEHHVRVVDGRFVDPFNVDCNDKAKIFLTFYGDRTIAFSEFKKLECPGRQPANSISVSSPRSFGILLDQSGDFGAILDHVTLENVLSVSVSGPACNDAVSVRQVFDRVGRWSSIDRANVSFVNCEVSESSDNTTMALQLGGANDNICAGRRCEMRSAPLPLELELTLSFHACESKWLAQFSYDAGSVTSLNWHFANITLSDNLLVERENVSFGPDVRILVDGASITSEELRVWSDGAATSSAFKSPAHLIPRAISMRNVSTDTVVSIATVWVDWCLKETNVCKSASFALLANDTAPGGAMGKLICRVLSIKGLEHISLDNLALSTDEWAGCENESASSVAQSEPQPCPRDLSMRNVTMATVVSIATVWADRCTEQKDVCKSASFALAASETAEPSVDLSTTICRVLAIEGLEHISLVNLALSAGAWLDCSRGHESKFKSLVLSNSSPAASTMLDENGVLSVESLRAWTSLEALDISHCQSVTTIDLMLNNMLPLKSLLADGCESLKNVTLDSNVLRTLSVRNKALELLHVNLRGSPSRVCVGADSLYGRRLRDAAGVLVAEIEQCHPSRVLNLGTMAERKALALVVMVGDGYVGKTSTVRRVSNQPLPDALERTRVVSFVDVGLRNCHCNDRNIDCTLRFVDFGGQDRYRSFTPMFVRRALFLIVYDLRQLVTFGELRVALNLIRYVNLVRAYVPEDELHFLLVGNYRDDAVESVSDGPLEHRMQALKVSAQRLVQSLRRLAHAAVDDFSHRVVFEDDNVVLLNLIDADSGQQQEDGLIVDVGSVDDPRPNTLVGVILELTKDEYCDLHLTGISELQKKACFPATPQSTCVGLNAISGADFDARVQNGLEELQLSNVATTSYKVALARQAHVTCTDAMCASVVLVESKQFTEAVDNLLQMGCLDDSALVRDGNVELGFVSKRQVAALLAVHDAALANVGCADAFLALLKHERIVMQLSDVGDEFIVPVLLPTRFDVTLVQRMEAPCLWPGGDDVQSQIQVSVPLNDQLMWGFVISALVKELMVAWPMSATSARAVWQRGVIQCDSEEQLALLCVVDDDSAHVVMTVRRGARSNAAVAAERLLRLATSVNDASVEWLRGAANHDESRKYKSDLAIAATRCHGGRCALRHGVHLVADWNATSLDEALRLHGDTKRSVMNIEQLLPMILRAPPVSSLTGRTPRKGLGVAFEVDRTAERGPLVRAHATIVFVHGIGGSGWRTWNATMQRGNQTVPVRWPDDLLLPTLQRAGIYARVVGINYDSFLNRAQGLAAGRRSSAGIKERGKQLADFLLDELCIGLTEPVVFVAHSMGGLLTKSMFLAALERIAEHGDPMRQFSASALLENTRLIVHLGVPHLCADDAALVVRTTEIAVVLSLAIVGALALLIAPHCHTPVSLFGVLGFAFCLLDLFDASAHALSTIALVVVGSPVFWVHQPSYSFPLVVAAVFCAAQLVAKSTVERVAIALSVLVALGLAPRSMAAFLVRVVPLFVVAVATLSIVKLTPGVSSWTSARWLIVVLFELISLSSLEQQTYVRQAIPAIAASLITLALISLRRDRSTWTWSIYLAALATGEFVRWAVERWWSAAAAKQVPVPAALAPAPAADENSVSALAAAANDAPAASASPAPAPSASPAPAPPVAAAAPDSRTWGRMLWRIFSILLCWGIVFLRLQYYTEASDSAHDLANSPNLVQLENEHAVLQTAYGFSELMVVETAAPSPLEGIWHKIVGRECASRSRRSPADAQTAVLPFADGAIRATMQRFLDYAKLPPRAHKNLKAALERTDPRDAFEALRRESFSEKDHTGMCVFTEPTDPVFAEISEAIIVALQSAAL
jgi:pimeloyl-ACP methyl ester carboxylesterase